MQKARLRQRLLTNCVAWCSVLALSVSAVAAGYRAEPLKEAAPKDVAKNVRDILDTRGLRILDPKGKAWVDIWLRKNVKTQKDEGLNGVQYGMLPEGSVLGVIRYHMKGADFRGHKFPAGVYTFRTGLQPEDGEHLGASDTRDFVLLCPSKGDVKLDPMTTDAVVKESVKVSGAKHPSILYVTKLFDKPEGLPRLIEDEDYEYWILDCQIADAADAKKSVRLGLVLVGRAEE